MLVNTIKYGISLDTNKYEIKNIYLNIILFYYFAITDIYTYMYRILRLLFSFKILNTF